MDQRFGTWMRTANIEVDSEYLSSRWAGVEALLADAPLRDVLRLVLVALKDGRQTEEGEKIARQAFWEHDHAFEMEGNDLELQTLCCVVAIKAVEANDSLSIDVALAILCLNLSGHYEAFPLLDVHPIAETLLQTKSLALRSNSSFQQLSVKSIGMAKALEEAKTAVTAGDAAAGNAAIVPVTEKAIAKINELVNVVNAWPKELNIQKEETDILWWLFAGESGELGKSYSDIEAGVGAVAGGRELSTLVVHRPGPLGAAAILSKVVKECADSKAKTLAEVVAALPMAWRTGMNIDSSSKSIKNCVILSAISLSVLHNDSSGWHDEFQTRFSHPLGGEINPNTLALQMYRECLLYTELQSEAV